MGLGASNLNNFRSKVVDVTWAAPGGAVDLGEVFGAAVAVSIGSGRTTGTINNAIIIDNDDKGKQLEFWFSDKQTAPAFGAASATPTVSTADALTIIGKIDSGATFTDFVNSQVATPAAFSPIAFSTENGGLYVAAILRGATTTFGTGNVVLRLHLTIEEG